MDPYVPEPQDRVRRLVKIPSGGLNYKGSRVLCGEHRWGIRGFEWILRVLEERHGEEWAVHP